MNVKSKVAVVTLMAMSLASINVMAATAGNSGKVTFTGEVVDSPCNLAPGQDGTDVKVDFGQLSMAQLNAGEKAFEPFVIKLENCALTTTTPEGVTTTKTAEITFNSTDVDGTNTALLKPNGSASGLGIGINGYTFGTAAPLNGLVDGNNDLRFTATAQQLVAGTPVTAGDFMASTNFVIAYQ
ncbi:type 1 fimbrial protein [Salmonella enterica subsp. enterica]|uniref:fimbrial protein n=1 Tax=Salmonella enterica TaxID=28901 RepID=UPI0009AE1679|nr:fimbrial protein [Salmonella enterica]EAA6923731.1 type 1 fimbrial protein [Salmonella enterica subsp. enterica serovar Pomona]EDB3638179.1 type 1 fimbrial protein [Salmonella enterica subsp. enterica serovar Oranienburg]EEJ7181655.1 type 1 fimbrial protein [Salmonella enterica subsp. enterica serovar Glostrup]HCM1959222.1 type 1 fimbrial protein [Salmonella enterica subsp. houtenae serovar Houten]EBG8828606.1 type 1 fimbrial protein [Salmonella enterica]